ncbi:hypothetical protein FPV67DRAFT_1652827 [Lyophyllum atratum]|nr:hypothetical protein FPV67DRAFT_1652827 [Lyophyllum atratum]
MSASKSATRRPSKLLFSTLRRRDVVVSASELPSLRNRFLERHPGLRRVTNQSADAGSPNAYTYGPCAFAAAPSKLTPCCIAPMHTTKKLTSSLYYIPPLPPRMPILSVTEITVNLDQASSDMYDDSVANVEGMIVSFIFWYCHLDHPDGSEAQVMPTTGDTSLGSGGGGGMLVRKLCDRSGLRRRPACSDRTVTGPGGGFLLAASLVASRLVHAIMTQGGGDIMSELSTQQLARLGWGSGQRVIPMRILGKSRCCGIPEVYGRVGAGKVISKLEEGCRVAGTHQIDTCTKVM